MPSVAQTIKWTYEDYLLFPDDGKRHELIDGDHFVSPSPSTRHQRISRKLLVAIGKFLEAHPVGEVFDAPCDVVLSGTDVVEPDLLFISDARKEIITDPNIQGAPDLVVEILSESNRKTDEVTKRKLYERCGVLEYWIVDPELEIIKIYRMADGHYTRSAELSREGEDSLTTPLLPGFILSLSHIF